MDLNNGWVKSLDPKSRLTQILVYYPGKILSPLSDGSWFTLPADALGADYAHFLNALKVLDRAEYATNPNTLDLDEIDFRIALGLPVTMSQLAGTSRTYSQGRSSVGMFGAFSSVDLLLARDQPHSPTVGPFPKENLEKSESGAKVFLLISFDASENNGVVRGSSLNS
ncbi:hypothetical protein B0H13DRAFT_1921003 [Mycena leptocephala]|nr:hypothetical protein B0H13DRAFT_1921003 [Mycena leptocephala]